MKKSIMLCIALTVSGQVVASGFGTMARVVSSQPVYVDQWVQESVPSRECREERTYRNTSEETRLGRVIVGGLIGSAIGREVSDSSRAGTVGAILGGAIASQPRYQAHQVCHDSYRIQNVRVSSFSHYDVTVTHRGRLVTIKRPFPAPIGSLVSVNQRPRHSQFRY